MSTVGVRARAVALGQSRARMRAAHERCARRGRDRARGATRKRYIICYKLFFLGPRGNGR